MVRSVLLSAGICAFATLVSGEDGTEGSSAIPSPAKTQDGPFGAFPTLPNLGPLETLFPPWPGVSAPTQAPKPPTAPPRSSGGGGLFGFLPGFGGNWGPGNRGRPNPSAPVKAVWQPRVASPFQIVLSGVLDLNTVKPSPVQNGTASQNPTELTPGGVQIFDLDLWETSTETVTALHNKGKKVICYFSAGTSEDWRPDFKQFKESDMGAKLPMWKGERWLDVRQRTVWTVMQKRIELASKRGCDAIDPDNVGKLIVQFH
jgi:hypothetical protein